MMRIWKFSVPGNKWVTDPETGLQHKGCIAAAVGPSASEARETLERFAATNGFDVGWLRVATITELPITDGTMIAWAQL